jgi:DMSO/TMAO reductase YedYZ molybdopterin-dependent catalytic subunit
MNKIDRREALQMGLGTLGLLAMSPSWSPMLAQDASDVPFTDIPKTFNPTNPNSLTRMFDLRHMEGNIVPKDNFFAIQHFNQPVIDAASWKLKFTGLVSKPVELSLADLKAMKSVEIVNGYECSGNSARSVQGLTSSGRFRGVPLAEVLKKVGVDPKAREVVFFGTDKGPQEVVFRAQTFKIDQQFGRSLTIENAMQPQRMIAYELNGEPLTKEQGFPARLINPGWYGVSNVKWLSEIHLQTERYLGNFQARWYRTIWAVGGTGEEGDPNTQFVETEVTHLRLKSVIGRVRKQGADHQIIGFVLNDGTDIKSVEVQIDGGAWQPAVLDKSNSKYSWKVFTYAWKGATPGEHTIVSRATDATGYVQPTAADLSRKKTFLEDNGQFPRKVMIG